MCISCDFPRGKKKKKDNKYSSILAKHCSISARSHRELTVLKVLNTRKGVYNQCIVDHKDAHVLPPMKPQRNLYHSSNSNWLT